MSSTSSPGLEPTSAPVIQLGRFTLDIAAGTLRRGDETVRLRPRSFQLLSYLAQHPGQVKSKSELIEAVWGPVAITDDAVTQSVIDIRRALGDDKHELVRTVPRRGYLLDSAAVTVAPAAPAAPSAPAPAGRSRGPGLLVAGLALALVAVWLLRSNAPPNLEAPSYSIAVLPFDDMSEEQNLGYFADGVSEEILNLLARVPDLRVIARTSSFSFRDETLAIDAIGKRLDVTHVLEGSVRESAGQLRITAQLIETATSGHVWSETYEFPQGELFAVQDRIAQAIQERLRVSLAEAPPRAGATVESEAYDLYLRATHLLDSSSWEQRYREADALFQAALAIDPNYAPIWRELARHRWLMISFGSQWKPDPAEVRVLLNRALALDPGDAATLAYLGGHAAEFDGDRLTGARLIQRALDQDPDSEAVLRIATGFAWAFLSPEQVVRVAERSVANNPLCEVCQFSLYRAYLSAQQLDQALAAVLRHRSIFRGGNFTQGLINLQAGDPEGALEAFQREAHDVYRQAGIAMAAWRLNRPAEYRQALAALEGAASRADGDPALQGGAAYFLLAQVYAQTERLDEAFAALESYAAANVQIADDQVIRGGLYFLGQLQRPILAPLHADPRWSELQRQLRLGPWQDPKVALTLP